MSKLKFPIYLDNHSTTPVDPEVLNAMLPYFNEKFGNPSSKSHSYGWEAELAVENSRKIIAEFINVTPEEIFFTSGTTESINFVIKGIVESNLNKLNLNKSNYKINHLITTKIEHSATLDVAHYLEKFGLNVIYLSVDKSGFVNLDELKNSITNETLLVSIIWANNEIGVIQNIEEITKICNDKNVLLHCDAAQAIGKIKIDLQKTKIDLMSFSAHKIYGPKGIGALFIRNKNPKIKITPLIQGGGHERGFRSGTQNVPAIVGFGKAIEIIQNNFEVENQKIKFLRDKLLNGLLCLENIFVNGDLNKRLSNNLNICFEGISSDNLIMNTREIAVSTSSACASESNKPSYVLNAIGLSDKQAKASIRFGIGRFNTEEEIEYVIKKYVEKIKYLRNIEV
ncbi:MAG: IscS subfamily cysteine desulfurase [Ignavibacterium sp.]